MSDEAALLRAIHTDPDDDTPRLVYADWLDEHGQPERAEFIRVQVELANQNDDSSDEAQKLTLREKTILEAHGTQWRVSVSPFNDGLFVRGFLEVVLVREHEDVSANFEFLHHLPALRRLHIKASLTPDLLCTIANLQCLEGLEIWSWFDPSWIKFLDPLPFWTYVYIQPFACDARGVWEEFQERRISRATRHAPDRQRLAAIRYLRGMNEDDKSLRPDRLVKSVKMWDIQTIDAEFRMLSYLPELEEIEIHRGHETVAGLRHFSSLPRLKKFVISDTVCDSLVPLMNCTMLEHLEYHSLGGAIGDDSVIGLERLTKLRHLVLCPCTWGNGFRDATLHRIGALRELRYLEIELGTRQDAETAWANRMDGQLWFASMLENSASVAALANLTNLEFLSINDDEYTGAELQQFLAGLRQH
ncbi:TIGR02996 domain-containing protein [Gemmata sp. G18]|uniref:TIGR02996 domain-containing protein n=1 Tax=Gemmata palustris TaxID=2822762 RepID=A0ABS5C328_9BACT|nr:TIGR02996 domain-containing protein [Gemmata palustris]MBP3960384.1 TIGR02996 domain-containing protein [Gemmata palustris]